MIISNTQIYRSEGGGYPKLTCGHPLAKVTVRYGVVPEEDTYVCEQCRFNEELQKITETHKLKGNK